MSLVRKVPKRPKASKTQMAILNREQSRVTILTQAEELLRIEHDSVYRAIDGYMQALENAPYNNIYMGRLNEIKTIWSRLNLGKISIEQQAQLYVFLTNDLPWAMRAAVATIETNAWPSSTAHGVQEIIQGMTAMLVDQHHLFHPMQIAASREAIFPQLPQVHPNLDNHLANLRQSWQQAYAHVNTVEDRFFLDQITVTYLPEMWQMYRPFQQGTVENEVRARQLVHDQLTLLEKGVDRVLNQSENVSFKNLEAHKIFLTRKLDQSETLTLG